MNAVLKLVAERIRGEVIDLDVAVNRAQHSWRVIKSGAADQDVYLDSVALNLQSFYTGIERLFELIARNIDQLTPGGDRWHRELLDQMAQEVVNTRPAVISTGNSVALDEFRRFRHLVRNVYAADLEPARMQNMLAVLPGLWDDLRIELSAFAEILEQAS